MQPGDLWYPEAAATGIAFARGQLEPTAVLWLHAAPEGPAVPVRDDEEHVVAWSETRRRAGDLGCLVLWPGGEVERLLTWWNAAAGAEWRRRVEFYNQRLLGR